nr:HEPN domain-containing protein [uncultured Campylobacter sp.]
MNIQDLNRLDKEIYDLFDKIQMLTNDSKSDTEIIKYLTNHAVLLMSGYIDKYFLFIIEDCVGNTATPKELKKFILNKISGRYGLTNLKSKKIGDILSEFSEEWLRLWSAYISDNNNQSTALGNIVDTRNKIAHGDSVNISISEYIRHYKDAKKLLEYIKKLFDSIRQI